MSERAGIMTFVSSTAAGEVHDLGFESVLSIRGSNDCGSSVDDTGGISPASRNSSEVVYPPSANFFHLRIFAMRFISSVHGLLKDFAGELILATVSELMRSKNPQVLHIRFPAASVSIRSCFLLLVVSKLIPFTSPANPVVPWLPETLYVCPAGQFQLSIDETAVIIYRYRRALIKESSLLDITSRGSGCGELGKSGSMYNT